MEIFQTIWTALTTENELLTNLLLFPTNFIESIINVLLFTTLLNINIERKKFKRYILCISLYLYISGIFIPNPYKSFINLMVLFLSIKFLLNIPTIKSFLCTLIPIFFSVLCESLIIKICSSIDFDIVSITSIPLYRLIFASIIQLFIFILYLIIKNFKVQILILENIPNKSKKIILINFVFAVLTIIVQFLITGFYIRRLPFPIVVLSNFTLIAYFFLNIYCLIKTMQFENATLSLEQEKEHNRILKLAQDDLRCFRHDFSNIICTIGGYVHTKDTDGLTNYYKQIQKDVVKVNNLTALNPDIINNPAIYALIVSKYDKASKLNINVSVDVFLDLNSLDIKIYEFTRILGILLDNSIEAAQECDEKSIYVQVRKDSKINRQLLIVENTYNNKDIDTDKIFEKNYSTKPHNTGLGLWEVRKILQKNNNLNLYTSKNNRLFKQQLEIYNR